MSRKVILLDGDVLIKGDLLGLLKLSSLDILSSERFTEIASPCVLPFSDTRQYLVLFVKQQPFSLTLSETPLPLPAAVLPTVCEAAAAYQRLEGASTSHACKCLDYGRMMCF